MKKLLLTLALIGLLIPSVSFGAIAIDSTTGGINTTSGLTLAQTIAEANELLLVVASHQCYNIQNYSQSMTYAGAAMTRVAVYNSAGPASSVSGWYIKNPATGTNNIVYSDSSGCDVALGTMALKGGTKSIVAVFSGGSDYSGTLNTTSNNNYVIMGASYFGDVAVSFAPGTGQTEIYDNTTGGYGVSGASSYKFFATSTTAIMTEVPSNTFLSNNRVSWIMMAAEEDIPAGGGICHLRGIGRCH